MNYSFMYVALQLYRLKLNATWFLYMLFLESTRISKIFLMLLVYFGICPCLSVLQFYYFVPTLKNFLYTKSMNSDSYYITVINSAYIPEIV